MDLLQIFDGLDHNEASAHLVVELFARIAKSENLPDKRAKAIAAGKFSEIEGLAPWQKFALNRLRPETFFDLPEDIRSLSAMHRYGTYDSFASEVINQGSPMPVALLSMFFKPKVIVEMGVHAGFTTLLFCRLNPDAAVYAVDRYSRMPDAPLPICVVPMLHGVQNLTVTIKEASKFEMPAAVDLCFVDADHTGDAPYRDSLRAWENRNAKGDWCIAWDDYHPNNPDVYSGINRFAAETGVKLQTLHSWVWTGSKMICEEELKRISL